MSPSRPRLLALGIDAAEPSLIQGWLEAGHLPFLSSLLGGGAVWGRVHSHPARIGSGSVWPTFMTGLDPRDHEVCSEWPWDPGRMAVAPLTTQHLDPFWRTLHTRGTRVAVFDVPMDPAHKDGCIAGVAEWGPHDRVLAGMAAHPPWVRAEVLGRLPHPFASVMPHPTGPEDHRTLARMASACLEGVRRRGSLALRLVELADPDLFIAVFPELHHAAHHLWHALDEADGDGGGLPEIGREIDRQIAGLASAAGPECAILVFSLHGMRRGHGVPTILEPLLLTTGWSALPERRAQSAGQRARQAYREAKRFLPRPLKDLYHRLVPRAFEMGAAQFGKLPPYDWPRTRAFSLPTDQHGWIRLNLVGREAAGIVEPGEYDATCGRIEALLRGLRTASGMPVVRDVLWVAGNGGPPSRLPDIVVHWEDAAHDMPLELADPAIAAAPSALDRTAQHAAEGFYVYRPGAAAVPSPGPVTVRDLHRFLLEIIEQAPDRGVRHALGCADA